MKFRKPNLKRYLTYLLMYFLIGLMVNFLRCFSCIFNLKMILIDILPISIVMGLTLHGGNSALLVWTHKKLVWRKNPGLKLGFSVVILTVYTFLASYIVIAFYIAVFHSEGLKVLLIQELYEKVFLTVIFISLITLIVAFVFLSREFLQNWKENALLNEKLKFEKLTSDYNALKSQVNPHFLFNSLNALSALVQSDQSLAVRFIKQLSEIYRYVLDHKESELVPLAEELDFVQSYIFLQNIRNEGKIFIRLNLEADSQQFVPPVSLQLLIENAIKHNAASVKKPLEVKVEKQNDYIVVSNNKQVRPVLNDSNNLGLENLKNRYEMFTDRSVCIEENSEKFEVRIPIIIKHEDSDY